MLEVGFGLWRSGGVVEDLDEGSERFTELSLARPRRHLTMPSRFARSIL